MAGRTPPRRTPPAAAGRLLKRLLSTEAFEVIAGDLDEEFHRGRSVAWYWWHTCRSIVAHLCGRVTSGTIMFGNDLRLAARALLRQRRLAAVATTTLGFGVALCVTVLGAVNAYLLRGLPYPDSDRLYQLQMMRGDEFPQGFDRFNWRSLDDIVEHAIAWDLDSFNLRGAPYTEAAQGTWVTPGYMTAFGVRTVLGRTFEPGDYVATAAPVAIISHRLWRTRFAGDPAIVGKTFESFSNDRPDEIGVFTIIGVLPEGHWHMQQTFTDVLSPLKAPSYPYLVRLRPGVTEDNARTRIAALIRAEHPSPDGWTVTLTSALAQYVVTVRPLLITLASAAVLVLLIATANVAVLLLVRANERRGEMAVRRALGASRLRLVRVIVAEAIVLGLAAGTVGVGTAALLLNTLAPLAAGQLGRAVPGGAAALQMDGLVWAGALAACGLIVLLCSVVPIVASLRATAGPSFAAGQKGAAGGRSQHRVRMALVVTEIAACLTLLVGASLMVQSAIRVVNTDMGLSDQQVQTMRLNLRLAAYPTPQSRSDLFSRVESATTGLADVQDLALASSWPLQASPSRPVRATSDLTAEATRAGVMSVSGSYFGLLGIPIRDGRPFDATDTTSAPPRAVISATLASRLWPDTRAIGRPVWLAPSPTAPAGTPPFMVEVIGVAEDTRHSHVDADLADVYLPLLQTGNTTSPFVYLKTSANTDAALAQVRSSLARIDTGLVTSSLQPLSDILDRQRSGGRFLAQVLVVFAAVAATLALVGLHGVLAYAAGQRKRELAIRIAIGADRATITVLLMRQGLVMVALGLITGIAGALALGQVLQAQLFGVKAHNPMMLAVVASAFGLCAMAASLVPARRASLTDPADALRAE